MDNVKHYSLTSTLFTIFSFTPLLLLVDRANNPMLYEDILPHMVLIISQIVITLFNLTSPIFYDFKSYYEEKFKIVDFNSDPINEKSNAVITHLVTIFMYLFPLCLSIALINTFALSNTKGLGFYTLVINTIYLILTIAAHALRFSKLCDANFKTYSEDYLWACAKWEMTKVLYNLTENNHSLMLTPAAYKDLTFMKFKNLVIEKLNSQESYIELSPKLQVLIKRELVEKTSIYLIRRCTKKYIGGKE